MSDERPTPMPVTRYVLAVFATMVVIILVMLPAVFFFDFTPPNSAGHITTLASTIVGVSWFARRVNRPMMNEERIWFAAGVTVVNAVVPFLYVVISLLALGYPLSLQSFDLAFGGGTGFLLESAMVWLIIFLLVLAFAQAYFFAWMLTRKLPRRAKTA